MFKNVIIALLFALAACFIGGRTAGIENRPLTSPLSARRMCCCATGWCTGGRLSSEVAMEGRDPLRDPAPWGPWGGSPLCRAMERKWYLAIFQCFSLTAGCCVMRGNERVPPHDCVPGAARPCSASRILGQG